MKDTKQYSIIAFYKEKQIHLPKHRMFHVSIFFIYCYKFSCSFLENRVFLSKPTEGLIIFVLLCQQSSEDFFHEVDLMLKEL